MWNRRLTRQAGLAWPGLLWPGKACSGRARSGVAFLLPSETKLIEGAGRGAAPCRRSTLLQGRLLHDWRRSARIQSTKYSKIHSFRTIIKYTLDSQELCKKWIWWVCNQKKGLCGIFLAGKRKRTLPGKLGKADGEGWWVDWRLIEGSNDQRTFRGC